MRVLPVLDLMSGQVVRGIAGRREEYRPIISNLTASSKPADVARAFRDRFGFQEVYLADLDAIAGAPPALAVYADLRALGFALWVDAGIHDDRSVQPLLNAGIESIVAGLETLAGHEALLAILKRVGPKKLVFSLDLRNKKPLASWPEWDRSDPWSIASEVIAIGIQRLLVLDLARVGMGSGTGTEDLCRQVAGRHEKVEISSGGGVRDIADLARLQHCGVHHALVASALHDGRIGPSDLLEFA
jgi:phosphoribosylformimino-5-aminoimidazole carboxamide ribotide isomerase